MSRNFEILRRAAAHADTFQPAAIPDPRHCVAPGPPDHRGATSEEVAKLVQRVFVYPPTASPPRMVTFCGVDEGVGCSWVCARAAEALAEQVLGRVCVVDANLRFPSLHEHFCVEMGNGFAGAMRDSAPICNFARSTCHSHLWLMTSGTLGSEPNGALNPERLRVRFSELRAEFDFVLIDTPPISSYPDAVLVGRLADGVVLVVESNSTRRESARVAKESLEAARVPILGAVLNRRTYPIPEAIYRRL